MPQLFQQPFDARNVQPREAFEPLPAGWYNAKISGSEAKPTKDNNSGMLVLELEILDGEYKGRKVWDRLNLWNNGENGEKVREIANRQLSAYCHATGVFVVQASEQLHGIPLKIKLAVRQDQGYDPTNDVKAVKHIQDTTAPTSAAPASGFAAPSQPASPFGMNPSLPAQPAPQVPFTPPAAAPVPQPAQPSPPWGSSTPAQPMPQQQPTQFASPQAPAASPPWGPPATAPTQAGGPVPPWRK